MWAQRDARPPIGTAGFQPAPFCNVPRTGCGASAAAQSRDARWDACWPWSVLTRVLGVGVGFLAPEEGFAPGVLHPCLPRGCRGVTHRTASRVSGWRTQAASRSGPGVQEAKLSPAWQVPWDADSIPSLFPGAAPAPGVPAPLLLRINGRFSVWKQREAFRGARGREGTRIYLHVTHVPTVQGAPLIANNLILVTHWQSPLSGSRCPIDIFCKIKSLLDAH